METARGVMTRERWNAGWLLSRGRRKPDRRRTCGRRAIYALAFVLLVTLLAPLHHAHAQEDTPTPQLPILLLNGAIYTQEYDPGELPAPYRREGYPAGTTSLYLVQCEGSIKEAWVEDLRSIGGEPRGYVPYNTLLVGMDAGALSRLQDLEFVGWHGLYQPYYKISPALQLRLAQGGEMTVVVELFSARLLPETLDALREFSVEILGAEGDAWCAVVALRMPAEEIDDVASLPAVEWMELCTAGTLPAEWPDGRLGPAGLYQTAEGVDEKVALIDTGVGDGGLAGIPDRLKGAVSSLENMRGDNGADASGHGTAMAGVLTGAGEAAVSSPGIDLIAYATGYGLGCPPQPLSLYSVLDDAGRRGAGIILCGSVPEGRESLGAYGIYASQRDAFVWYNPAAALVEAAGNEGTDSDADGRTDPGSLLGGATAKNVLSVGGCENTSVPQPPSLPLAYSQLEELFPGRFPAAPLRDDLSAGAPAGMAAFSSRGPTRDGRIKPDLVAAATAVSTLAAGGDPAPGILPSGTEGYVQAYGTSMAAATVASALAAMRSPLAGVQEAEPSAALLKAFVVNGAKDLAPGQYGEQAGEIPPAPNVVEGWGRLDLEGFTRTGSWVKVLDDGEGMRLDESRVFRLEVTSGKELRVTLAWSDYPSLPQARLHLVNDLDLRVRDPEGNIFYPNGRNSRDPLNNIERVVVDISGKTGDYTIELSAWNVPFSPQPFALVAQVF